MVGDQSRYEESQAVDTFIDADYHCSGKSSVLEGLTSLPFPRDSGLCTRFATQITFRRSTATRISVSIIPAGDAQLEHAETLRAWKKDELQALDRPTFAAILEEVSETYNCQSQIWDTCPSQTECSDVVGCP